MKGPQKKCYNEELVCPRQIDDESCDCEWLPAKGGDRMDLLLTDTEIMVVKTNPTRGIKEDWFIANYIIAKVEEVAIAKAQAELDKQENIDATADYAEGKISVEKWAERLGVNAYALYTALNKYGRR